MGTFTTLYEILKPVVESWWVIVGMWDCIGRFDDVFPVSLCDGDQ